MSRLRKQKRTLRQRLAVLDRPPAELVEKYTSGRYWPIFWAGLSAERSAAIFSEMGHGALEAGSPVVMAKFELPGGHAVLVLLPRHRYSARAVLAAVGANPADADGWPGTAIVIHDQGDSQQHIAELEHFLGVAKEATP